VKEVYKEMGSTGLSVVHEEGFDGFQMLYRYYVVHCTNRKYIQNCQKEVYLRPFCGFVKMTSFQEVLLSLFNFSLASRSMSSKASSGWSEDKSMWMTRQRLNQEQ
jgi:hypothetical protein